MNHGILAGRVGIVGGVPFALAVLLGCQFLGALFSRRLAPTTGAVFGALLVMVAIVWHVDTSLSPDMMVWLLPLVVVTIITDSNASDAEHLGTFATQASPPGMPNEVDGRADLAYCAALLVWRFARRPRRSPQVSAIEPHCAWRPRPSSRLANFIATGCPLFRSPICFNGATLDCGYVASMEPAALMFHSRAEVESIRPLVPT